MSGALWNELKKTVSDWWIKDIESILSWFVSNGVEWLLKPWARLFSLTFTWWNALTRHRRLKKGFVRALSFFLKFVKYGNKSTRFEFCLYVPYALWKILMNHKFLDLVFNYLIVCWFVITNVYDLLSLKTSSVPRKITLFKFHAVHHSIYIKKSVPTSYISFPNIIFSNQEYTL